MSNIRKVTIGTEINTQMSYSLGSKHSFFLDGQKVSREIHNIIENENSFFIYIINPEQEVQLWKKLPKNNSTTVEYVID
jgi:hypothetical protein